MNLLIDIGNSRVKAALWEEGRCVAQRVTEHPVGAWFDCQLREFDVREAIFSSTRGDAEPLWRLLAERFPRAVRFTPATPVPIAIDYATPETLGRDRVAAAVGAATLHAGRETVIVDFGTALTIDRVTADGTFRGGAISPGVTMRLRALHDYTASLPLCDPFAEGGEAAELLRSCGAELRPGEAADAPSERAAELQSDCGSEQPQGCGAAAGQRGSERASFPLAGRSTREAIERGVLNSVAFEIEGYLDRLGAENADLCVIFTGGEAKYFVKRIKNTIFAEPNLVFCGLNRILEYHATTQRQMDEAPRNGAADACRVGRFGADEQH